jgi:hypothetical protein
MIMKHDRSIFRLRAGDLVSLTLREGHTHTPRTVYGVVLEWADSNQYDNACALVMVDGVQAWYDYKDMCRLNDVPEDRASARMRVDA